MAVLKQQLSAYEQGLVVQVILYQPGRAAEKASPAPITSAPAGHTAMDVSPQRALSAAMSHEVANLPGAPAVSAGEQGRSLRIQIIHTFYHLQSIFYVWVKARL